MKSENSCTNSCTATLRFFSKWRLFALLIYLFYLFICVFIHPPTHLSICLFIFYSFIHIFFCSFIYSLVYLFIILLYVHCFCLVIFLLFVCLFIDIYLFFLSFVYIFICLCVLFIYWQCCDVSCSFYMPIALIVMTIGNYWKTWKKTTLVQF